MHAKACKKHSCSPGKILRCKLRYLESNYPQHLHRLRSDNSAQPTQKKSKLLQMPKDHAASFCFERPYNSKFVQFARIHLIRDSHVQKLFQTCLEKCKTS